MEHLRVLYVASFGYGDGSTSLHRLHAMRDLVALVVAQDTTPEAVLAFNKQLWVRVVHKFLGKDIFSARLDWGGINSALIHQINTHQFDILWLDKGNDINPEVFHAFRRRFPNGQIVGYVPDDMHNPQNRTQNFLKTLPLYDVFFTTKSYQVPELKEQGCPRVCFVGNAYHEPLHHPMELTPQEQEAYQSEVCFIGAWEKDRAESLLYLAKHGVPLRIWGDDIWKKKVLSPPPSMRLEGFPLFGVEYSKAVCATKICLGFLRKVNRDLQTTRSVEVPACGTMMLAERTTEHLQLFEEGKEAEFFDSKEELLQKVQYYLQHPKEREAIAQAGRRRCVESGYSNHERMRYMLGEVLALK